MLLLIQEDYGNKLREKYGLDSTAPVNELDDPDFEIWQVCIGGVSRGRLSGLPGEKWSKRSGNIGVSGIAAHVNSQEDSDKLQKLEKDLEKKTQREADMYSFIASPSSYIADQNSVITSMAQFMQIIATQFGIQAPPIPTLCPPPTPPPFTCTTSNGVSNIPDDPSSSRLDENDEDSDEDKDQYYSDDDVAA